MTSPKAVASTGTLPARGSHDQDSSASRKASAGKVFVSCTPVVDNIGEAAVQRSRLAYVSGDPVFGRLTSAFLLRWRREAIAGANPIGKEIAFVSVRAHVHRQAGP